MIVLELAGAMIAGGVIGAAVAIRSMPRMVSRLDREERLKFARIVSALANDE